MASREEKEWFYMALGHRRGPVTRDTLCEMLLNEELYIESTQVWREGMKEWEELADCKAFASTLKKVREAARQTEANVRHAASSDSKEEDLICRGASRALYNCFFYIGWTVPILIGVVILTELQVYQIIDVSTVVRNKLQYIVPLTLLLLALCQMSVSRMRHAGYPAWLGVTVFVPIWNFFIFFVCLFTPQNFKRKKRLGKAALAYFLLFLAMLALPFSGLFTGLNPQSVNLFSVTQGMIDAYKYQTSFSTRLKHSKEKAEAAEERRKELEEKEREEREKSQRKRSGE
ncbi:DUF4339 domain-containing protein [Rubritalea spongiae]|uniref:DUF4339 domain-containing protein n=1 Tax=Rubritalea spongiae TaxID=430797 RepID=A0ABW5DZV3_9BACT